MSITIKDVAIRAGVSVSTVSKALNGSAEIPQQTCARVRAAADALGFIPNRHARELKTKHTKNIVFIGRFEEDDAFTKPHIFEIMAGCNTVFQHKDYSFAMFNRAGARSEQIERMFCENVADGFVIHAGALDKKLIKTLEKRVDLPYVIIGNPNAGDALFFVDNDNFLSGALSARHLIDIGKKHIAYIGGEKYDAISEARFAGVMEYLKSVGGGSDNVLRLRGESTKEDGEYMAGKLISGAFHADAVICANNTIAVGVINCFNRACVRIPDDIAVISFDKHPYSQITSPMLTVVDINMYALGSKAASILLEKIKNPAYDCDRMYPFSSVIVRGSTVIKK